MLATLSFLAFYYALIFVNLCKKKMNEEIFFFGWAKKQKTIKRFRFHNIIIKVNDNSLKKNDCVYKFLVVIFYHFLLSSNKWLLLSFSNDWAYLVRNKRWQKFTFACGSSYCHTLPRNCESHTMYRISNISENCRVVFV